MGMLVGTAYVDMMVNANPLRMGLNSARTETAKAVADMDRSFKTLRSSVAQGANAVEGDVGRITKSATVLERVMKGVSSGFGFGIGISVWHTALNGIQGLIGGVSNAVVGMNSKMENVGAQLLAFTKDAEVSKGILAAIREEADKTPFAFEEMASAVTALIPSAKQAQVPLMELVKTAEILAASNPAQGLAGAAFSLREATSGDFTSIIERFNISRSAINKFKAEGMQPLEAVNAALKEMGYDISLVDNLAKTFTGRLSTLKDTFAGLQMRATAPIFEVLKVALGEFSTLLANNKKTLDGWADAIGLAGGRAAQDIMLTIKLIGEGIMALPKIVQSAVSLFQATIATVGQASSGMWQGWGDDSIPLVTQVFGRVTQLARDAFLTVKQAWAGEWFSDSSINPLVDGFGRATVAVRMFLTNSMDAFDGLRDGTTSFAGFVDSIVRDVLQKLGWLFNFDPTPFIDMWDTAQQAMFDFADAVSASIDSARAQIATIGSWLEGVGQQFVDFAAASYVWGHNFVVNFANGIMGAIGTVVDSLNAIGEIISYWLEPHSPPKIAPDLDKWGTEAATLYMNSWGKADFGVFDELSNTIQGYLRGLVDLGQFPQEGVIPTILGTQSVLAQVINQLRDTGKATDELLNSLVTAAGPAGTLMRDLIQTYSDLYTATKKVEDAQKAVETSQRKVNAAQKDANDAQRAYNDTVKKYTVLLQPMQKELDALALAQRRLSDAQRATQLGDDLADANDPRLKRLQEIARAEEANANAKRRADLNDIISGKKEGDANAAKLELEKLALEESIAATARQRQERDKAADIEAKRLEQQAAEVKNRINAVETERDAAAQAAKDRVDAAKQRVEDAQEELQSRRDLLTVETDAQKVIQDRLDIQQKLIDEQNKHNGLVSQQVKLQEQLAQQAAAQAKSAEAAAKAASGGGAGSRASGNLARPSLPSGGALDPKFFPKADDNGPKQFKLEDLKQPRWLTDLQNTFNKTANAAVNFGTLVSGVFDALATAAVNPTLAFQKLYMATPMELLPWLYRLRDGWHKLSKFAGDAATAFDKVKKAITPFVPQIKMVASGVLTLVGAFFLGVKKVQDWFKAFNGSESFNKFMGMLLAGKAVLQKYADMGKGALQWLIDAAQTQWENPAFKPWIDKLKFISQVIKVDVVPALERLAKHAGNSAKAIFDVFTPERSATLLALFVDITNIIAGDYLGKLGVAVSPLEAVGHLVLELVKDTAELVGKFLDLVKALKESKKWGWLYHAALQALGIWIGLNLISDLAVKFGGLAGKIAGATTSLAEFGASQMRWVARVQNGVKALADSYTNIANKMAGTVGPTDPTLSRTGKAAQATAAVVNRVTNVINNVKTSISTAFASAKDALIWAQLYGEQAMDAIVKKIKIEMPNEADLKWPEPPTIKVGAGDAPKPVIPEIKFDLAELGKAMGAKLAGGIASGVGAALGTALGPALVPALPYIGIALAAVGLAAAAFFVAKFIAGIVESRGGIGPALAELFTQGIPEALGAIVAGVINVVNFIGVAALEGLATVGPKIFDFIKENWQVLLLGAIAVVFGPISALMVAFFATVGPDLLGILGDIVGAIIGWWGDLIGIVMTRGAEVVKAFQDAWNGMIAVFVKFKDDMWDNVKKTFEPLGEMIRNIMEGNWGAALKNALEFLYQVIIGWPTRTLGALASALGGFVTVFLKLGSDLLTTVTGFLTDIWTAFTTRLETLVGDVGTRLTSMWTKMQEFGTNIKTTWEGIWNGIGTFFSTFGSNFKSSFDKHLDKDLLEKAESWKEKILSALKWPFEQLRDKVGGIMEAAKEAMLGPLRVASTAIDKFVGGAGKAIGWIGKIFGKEVKTDGAPSAAGGGFSGGLNLNKLKGDNGNWRGGMAWVGEKGPELMYVPREAVIVPNQQSANIAKAGAAPALPTWGYTPPPGSQPGFFAGLNLKDLGGTLMDLLGKGAKAPEWLLQKAIDATGWKAPELPGVLTETAGPLFETVKNWLITKVKDWISTALPVDGESLSKMINAAEAAIGTPYSWGGGHGATSAGPWDCSGFVRYILDVGGIPNPGGIVTDFYNWMTKDGGNGAVDIGINNPFDDPRTQHTGIRLAGTTYESGGPFGGVGKNGTAFKEWGSPPGMGKFSNDPNSAPKGDDDSAITGWRNILEGKVKGQFNGPKSVPPLETLARLLADDPDLLSRNGMQRLLRALPQTIAMATGGTINEPVFGVGRSGKTYLVGENGTEVVTPIRELHDVADVIVGALATLGGVMRDGFNAVVSALQRASTQVATAAATNTPPPTPTVPSKTAPAPEVPATKPAATAPIINNNQPDPWGRRPGMPDYGKPPIQTNGQPDPWGRRPGMPDFGKPPVPIINNNQPDPWGRRPGMPEYGKPPMPSVPTKPSDVAASLPTTTPASTPVTSTAKDGDGKPTTTAGGRTGGGVAELRFRIEQTIDTVDGRIITQSIIADPLALEDLTEGVTEVQTRNIKTLAKTGATGTTAS